MISWCLPFAQDSTAIRKIAASALAIGLGACLALIAPMAEADSPSPQRQLHEPVEVSDSVLANMRGRYAQGNRVVYFGVQMSSQWTTADGQNLGVGMSLGVPMGRRLDRDTQPELRRTITTNSPRERRSRREQRRPELGDRSRSSDIRRNPGRTPTRTEHATTRANRTVTVNGFDDTKGVVQRVHLAGDRNSVRNSARMDIDGESSEDAGEHFATSPEDLLSESAFEEESPAPGNSTLQISEDVIQEPGTQTMVTESGAVISTRVERSGLGMSIEVPGKGRVVQQIAGGGLDEIKGILQNVQLTGDLQQIQNILDIQAVFEPPKGFSSDPRLDDALRSLINLQLNR